MNAVVRWRWGVGLAACVVTVPMRAQVSQRDSAGISITSSASPSRPADAVVLASSPRVVISARTDGGIRLQSIQHVAVLSDSRIVVADAETGQLHYFSNTGTLLFSRAGLGTGADQIPGMRIVRRTVGDTVAISTGRTAVVRYDGTGSRVDTGVTPAPSGPPRQIVADVLASGHHVVAALGPMEERPRGHIWVASLPLALRAPSAATTVDLGAQPMTEMEQTSSGPSPRWLSPVGVITGSTSHVYVGFGSRYEVRAYGLDGALQLIIRRAWTPIPISDADWETWVIEWSKRWITSSGEQRIRDVQAMRDAPWADTLPAFSQLLADRVGRVWVRRAHWQDAIAAGSLTDMPVVPSEWSVFDERGVWLYDVTMPANFQAFEIGRDYVAGRMVTDKQQVAAVFQLVPSR